MEKNPQTRGREAPSAAAWMPCGCGLHEVILQLANNYTQLLVKNIKENSGTWVEESGGKQHPRQVRGGGRGAGFLWKSREDCLHFAEQEEIATRAPQHEGKKGLTSFTHGRRWWQPFHLLGMDHLLSHRFPPVLSSQG